jgi:hypothetical protein
VGDPSGRWPPVIVDTGFGEDAAVARNRTITRSVNDGPARGRHRPPAGRGRDPDPTCTTTTPARSAPSPTRGFHVQDAEMAFATGRQVCDREVRAPFDGEPVAQLVRKLYNDHVVFHAGDEEIRARHFAAPVPRPHRRAASGMLRDGQGNRGPRQRCAHLYANLTPQHPFPIFVDEADYARPRRG